MHLIHPLQTVSFFHLPASSASAFDVGYPGVWRIQSWGMKRSGSVLLLLRTGFSLIPLHLLLFLSFFLLPSIYLSCLSVLPSTRIKQPFLASFLLNQDGHFSFSCTHWCLNHWHTSSTSITSHMSTTAHLAHFIKEPLQCCSNLRSSVLRGVHFMLGSKLLKWKLTLAWINWLWKVLAHSPYFWQVVLPWGHYMHVTCWRLEVSGD